VKTHWTNVTVVSPTAEIASDLLIDGVRIAGIVPSATSTGDDWQAIDGQGAVLFPGMIDLLPVRAALAISDWATEPVPISTGAPIVCSSAVRSTMRWHSRSAVGSTASAR